MNNVDVSIFERSSTKSLFEWDGVDELLSFVRKEIKENYASGDPLAPVAYIIYTEDPDGEILVDPAVAVIKPSDVQMFSREAFLFQVATLCEEAQAVGVVLAFEGWLIEGTHDEINAASERDLIDLRKDVLVVSLEHKDLGKKLWRAELLTKGILTEIGAFDLAEDALTQHMALLE